VGICCAGIGRVVIHAVPSSAKAITLFCNDQPSWLCVLPELSMGVEPKLEYIRVESPVHRNQFSRSYLSPSNSEKEAIRFENHVPRRRKERRQLG
jgi:hypothetical protein